MNELQYPSIPSLAVYAGFLLNSTGQVWNTSTQLFETRSGANRSSYAIAMVDSVGDGMYLGSFPSALSAAGTYKAFFYLGSAAAASIADIPAGDGLGATQTIVWPGSVVVGPSLTPPVAGYGQLYGIAHPTVGTALSGYVTIAYTRNGAHPELVDGYSAGPVTDTLPVLVDAAGLWVLELAASTTGTSYTVSLTVGDVTTTETLILTSATNTAF